MSLTGLAEMTHQVFDRKHVTTSCAIWLKTFCFKLLVANWWISYQVLRFILVKVTAACSIISFIIIRLWRCTIQCMISFMVATFNITLVASQSMTSWGLTSKKKLSKLEVYSFSDNTMPLQHTWWLAFAFQRSSFQFRKDLTFDCKPSNINVD